MSNKNLIWINGISVLRTPKIGLKATNACGCVNHEKNYHSNLLVLHVRLVRAFNTQRITSEALHKEAHLIHKEYQNTEYS